MAISTISPKYFLGSFIPNVKILSAKIDEMINVINSLQAQLDAAQALLPTVDQKAALDGAASPDGSNVFATMADV